MAAFVVKKKSATTHYNKQTGFSDSTSVHTAKSVRHTTPKAGLLRAQNKHTTIILGQRECAYVMMVRRHTTPKARLLSSALILLHSQKNKTKRRIDSRVL